jgi:hypothetical protein
MDAPFSFLCPASSKCAIREPVLRSGRRAFNHLLKFALDPLHLAKQPAPSLLFRDMAKSNEDPYSAVLLVNNSSTMTVYDDAPQRSSNQIASLLCAQRHQTMVSYVKNH